MAAGGEDRERGSTGAEALRAQCAVLPRLTNASCVAFGGCIAPRRPYRHRLTIAIARWLAVASRFAAALHRNATFRTSRHDTFVRSVARTTPTARRTHHVRNSRTHASSFEPLFRRRLAFARRARASEGEGQAAAGVRSRSRGRPQCAPGAPLAPPAALAGAADALLSPTGFPVMRATSSA